MLRSEMVTRTALRHASASWLEHCINFESMFVANLMPYTIQPNVLAGRVDLPAVFLHRDSLVASKVQFGTSVIILVSCSLCCCVMWLDCLSGRHTDISFRY
jgi:hypothetical protein